jgi:hypothetical protein
MATLPTQVTGQEEDDDEEEEEAEVVIEEEEDYNDLSIVALFPGSMVCCTSTTLEENFL